MKYFPSLFLCAVFPLRALREIVHAKNAKIRELPGIAKERKE